MRLDALWVRIGVLAAAANAIVISIGVVILLRWSGSLPEGTGLSALSIAALGAALVVLSVPLALGMSHRLLRPLAELGVALAQWRDGGQAVMPEPVDAPRELADLIRLGNDYQRRNAELQAELGALRLVMRQGQFRANAEGVVVEVNQTLAALLGDSPAAIVEQRRFSPLHLSDADAPTRVDSDGTPLIKSRFVRLTRADQPPRPAIVRVVPICIDNQRIGYAGTVEDVSERLMAADQRLMLSAVAEQTDDLIVVVDGEGRLHYTNRAAREFWGMPSASSGSDNLLRYLSCEHAAALIESALPAAQNGGGWVGEALVTGVDGSQIPVGQRIIAVQGVSGHVHSFAIVMRDLSLERAVEQNHEDLQRRLRRIVGSIPALVAYLDLRERFRFANRAFRDWLGLDPAAMIGSTLREQFGPDVYERIGGPLQPAFEGEVVEFECSLGSLNYVQEVHVLGLPDRHPSGRIVGVHLLVHDITAKRLEERRLARLSHHDPLTGLFDRDGFDEAFREACQRAEQTGGWVGLLRVDIDGLRQADVGANGAVGDVMLREVGARLRVAVRRSDVVCRLSDVGFAIVLDAISQPSDAGVVADKVVDIISVPFFVANEPVRLAVSIGVASYGPSRKATAQEVLAQAERALGDAHRAGSDQVVIACESDAG